MFKRFIKLSFFLSFASALILGAGFGFAPQAEAVDLRGRILLQVQDKGQAWYVNPLDNKRYYLGRPEDAFNLMRSLGLGVSTANLNSYLAKAPARFAGRILLKVQDKGQAYYVDPVNLKLYYLGKQADAFNVMRSRGLGISNKDLATIKIAAPNPVTAKNEPSPSQAGQQIGNFNFKYQNKDFTVSEPLSSTLFESYKNSPKVYSYIVGEEPANLRDEFYALFLKLKPGDKTIDEIILKLKNQAQLNNWSDDELLEFVFAFVQYIPYDHAKVTANATVNTNPYFPYETLYLDKGVCSDKTFLALVLLRKLGYGAAILDFPERNHTALGVACPKEYSINNSGYCYGETTNYFPLGVVPQSINNGQAKTSEEFTNLFDPSNLGKIEIYQATTGKLYQGMSALQSRIVSLKNSKIDIDARSAEINSLSTNLKAQETAVKDLKTQLDAYLSNGQITEYNNSVANYNNLVNQYNVDLAAYRTKIDVYNAKVAEFNAAVKYFYQQ